MNTPGQKRSGLRERLREELRYFLEIVALTGFVVAQPVLDVFGRSPETFVFRGADRGDIVLFAAIVVAVPPLLLGAGAALTNIAGPKARRGAQVVVLSVLFGVLALQVVKKATRLHDGTLLVVAIMAAVAFAVVYLRVTPLRLWVRYASVGPALFLVLFLVASPAADLVRTGDASAAADVEQVDDPAPVVMFVLDELPLASIMRSDGTIDAELFPNFAALGAQSTWYRNATTVGLRTFYAMPAILTGRYPDGRQIPVSGAYPENLFTWLDGSYDVEADETITRLCPPAVCPRGADQSAPTSHLLDDARDVWADVSSPGESTTNPTETLEEPIADEGDRHFHRQARADGRANTPERFEEFLDRIQADDEPSLDFLHLLLPHGPSRYYPSGVTYDWHGIPGGRGGGNGDTWTTDSALVATQRQRHLLQLQYADSLVGRFIDRLKKQGVWDEAVVVVTADHGIAFTPGQSSRAGDADAIQPSWPQLVWVPLFIRAPELEAGVVSDRNVQTIDIVPTIADLAGVELPWDVDGISAVGTKERPADTKEFLNSWSDSGVEKPGTRRPVDPVAGNANLREHTIDRFLPDGDPQWAVYQAGPRPELVGTSVADHAASSAPAGSVELDKPGRFEDASPSDGKVPGAIWGTVDGVDPAASDVLAVAVNGTIGATTRIARETPGVGFSVIPPDFLWRDGANDVAVFLVVERPDGGVELRPLPAV